MVKWKFECEPVFFCFPIPSNEYFAIEFAQRKDVDILDLMIEKFAGRVDCAYITIGIYQHKLHIFIARGEKGRIYRHRHLLEFGMKTIYGKEVPLEHINPVCGASIGVTAEQKPLLRSESEQFGSIPDELKPIVVRILEQEFSERCKKFAL